MYLSCHAIPAIINKNTDDILRNRDNHQLESFALLDKDNEVGQKSQHET